jgi:magnesium-transporting ATPase (P-type)
VANLVIISSLDCDCMAATDAAREVADIVLTKEGLSAIVTGITVARVIFGRMTNFISYRIAGGQPEPDAIP